MKVAVQSLKRLNLLQNLLASVYPMTMKYILFIVIVATKYFQNEAMETGI